MEYKSESRGKVIDTRSMKPFHCYFAGKKMIANGEIKKGKQMVRIAIRKAERKGWTQTVEEWQAYMETIPA